MIILKINIRVTALIISLTIIFSISGFDPAKAASEDFVIENGVLIEYKGNDTEVTIPDGVKEIGDDVFNGCDQLEKVNMPSSLESIGKRAFNYCEKLNKVTLPDAVKEIGESAFGVCTALSHVNLPEHLDYIGDYAFGWCFGLATADLPESVDAMGIGVFYGTSIENPIIFNNGKLLCYVPHKTVSYQIPSTVTEIAGGAFWYCESLSSVTIPASVTKIDDEAFRGCKSLLNINIPDSVKEIGCSVFTETAIKDPIIINNGKTLCYVPSNTEEYIVSNQVTEIAGGAFRYCDVKSVTLPDKLTKINDYTFGWCGNIRSIDLPEGLTSIGISAFTSCDDLVLFTVPNSVKEIKDDAFSYCRNLSEFTIPGGVSTIGEGAFDSCTQLSMVVVENGVKSIGRYAFSRCTQLTSVSIPDSMREIGTLAFSACDSLKTITIPSSLTSLGDDIFYATHVTVTGEEGSAIEPYCAKFNCPFIAADLSRVAVPTVSAVLLNGINVKLQAYNIQGNNYFKLRDLAMALRDTEKPFQVEYDASSYAINLTGGRAYTPIGGELSTLIQPSNEKAKLSAIKVCFNGSEVDLQAYNINGFNYFKLRDVAAVIDVGVTWDGKTSTIGIDTNIGYNSLL